MSKAFCMFNDSVQRGFPCRVKDRCQCENKNKERKNKRKEKFGSRVWIQVQPVLNVFYFNFLFRFLLCLLFDSCFFFLFQQTIKYDEPFFNPPIVLTTVFNAAQGNKSNNGCGPKQKEPLLTWMEVRVTLKLTP